MTNISLSCIHILALADDGKLLAWGYNDNGRCGVDSLAGQIEVPTRVPIPENYKVDDISAGRYHSMIKCSLKK